MKGKHTFKNEPEEQDTELTPLKKRFQPKKNNILLKRRLRQSASKKWIALALCCFVMAVMYYLLAMPAALHRQLQSVMPNDDNNNFEMNFGLLFTVSYFPNMILPIFGGQIVDRCGPSKCLIAFCVIVFVGQCLVAVGVSYSTWPLLWLGRLVFGLGAQNLIVANASLISKWFAATDQVASALGLVNVCSYAGVIATNVCSPKLANLSRLGPSLAFWIGVGLEIVAFVLSVIVMALDVTMKKDDDNESMTLTCSPMFSPIAYRRFSSAAAAADATPNNMVYSPAPGGLVVSFRNVDKAELTSNKKHFKPTFWLLCASFLLVYGVVWSFTNVSSAILLERDFFVSPPNDCILQQPNQCSSGYLAPKQGNTALDPSGQPCVMIADNVAPVIPDSLNVSVPQNDNDDKEKQSLSFEKHKYQFEKLSGSDIACQDDFWSEACTENYCDAQTLATEKAGFYMSIPYFFTVALTFHLGLLVDSTGYRTELICVGSTLLVVAHALLAHQFSWLMPAPVVVPLMIQGLGYTICVAALWPSVPFTVSQDSVGAAFGIMMSVQNVGLALIPLLVAHLYRLGNNHYLPMVEIFFAVCSFVAVLVGIALMLADKKTDHILGTPKVNIRYSSETKGLVAIKPTTVGRSGLARGLSDPGILNNM